MTNKVIATIDVTHPCGHKIVRDLQNKRGVKLEYPLPEDIENVLTHEEIFAKAEKKLNDHYGTNYKLK
ncbi:MAG TPA: hypothetical protein DDZ96_01820 [Porphyromonadaceae bacterium]|jgi:hypothetical protein|uniref:hypothetical protein n=1 Tax=Limibacterium fermenti TaxID=3229863 RepID=UPI000E99E110|nr:hypothetical protein [Porphyromonadaceae bacterium]HBL32544.1 hypothetical protein [Porphyromonadaceae bacterium]HBX45386.1 hypothetical protein [Porphyromonadaceae bacterium]HCM20103.1 hypothetical protein [Porphyromonadaceae bacterium]